MLFLMSKILFFLPITQGSSFGISIVVVSELTLLVFLLTVVS